jgi:hypothetical protein
MCAWPLLLALWALLMMAHTASMRDRQCCSCGATVHAVRPHDSLLLVMAVPRGMLCMSQSGMHDTIACNPVLIATCARKFSDPCVYILQPSLPPYLPPCAWCMLPPLAVEAQWKTAVRGWRMEAARQRPVPNRCSPVESCLGSPVLGTLYATSELYKGTL